MRALEPARLLHTAVAFHEMRDVVAPHDPGLVGAALFDRARLAFARRASWGADTARGARLPQSGQVAGSPASRIGRHCANSRPLWQT
jgi:hypothetical protein